MIIASYTCPYCGVHCISLYDVDIKAKIVFLNCSNLDALLELGEINLEQKGGENERKNNER